MFETNRKRRVHWFSLLVLLGLAFPLTAAGEDDPAAGSQGSVRMTPEQAEATVQQVLQAPPAEALSLGR